MMSVAIAATMFSNTDLEKTFSDWRMDMCESVKWEGWKLGFDIGKWTVLPRENDRFLTN